MKYSEYSFEQIMEDDKYKEICDSFLNLDVEDEIKENLTKILYDGGVDGYSLRPNIHRENNPHTERLRRSSMAYLYLNDPETFEVLKENHINIFHGTNANALPGILKYGLHCGKKLEEENIRVTTGELWSRTKEQRDFISFTDVFEIAQSYSLISAIDRDYELDFPVIFGTTESDIAEEKVFNVTSDLSEIGVLNDYPVERIRCICVPKDKVKLVEKMVNQKQIKVLGMSNLENKFIYTTDLKYVKFSSRRYKNFIKNREKTKERISDQELEEVARTRKVSKMKKLIHRLKELTSSKENEYGGRAK